LPPLNEPAPELTRACGRKTADARRRGSKCPPTHFFSMGPRKRLAWRSTVLAVATPLLFFVSVLGAQSPSAPNSVSLAEIAARRELLILAFEWLDATVARDFAAQSRFYPETMEAFYLWRNVPKSAVLAEKRRVFEEAKTIRIRMEPPQILVDADASSARMYFRKQYRIKGRVDREGEVLQELRWVRGEDGWKIVSERDLRVVRRARVSGRKDS
jgi:hypothetical protein